MNSLQILHAVYFIIPYLFKMYPAHNRWGIIIQASVRIRTLKETKIFFLIINVTKKITYRIKYYILFNST